MKLIIIIFLCLHISICKLLFRRDINNTDLEIFSNDTKKDKAKIWNILFGDVDSATICPVALNMVLIAPETVSYLSADAKLLPKRKANNPYVHNYGFGPVAYLFDYMDEIMQPIMCKLFENLWKDAIKYSELLASNSTEVQMLSEDPYDLSKILSIHNKILTGMDMKLDSSKMSDEEITTRMKKITSEFDLAIYRNSLTGPTLEYIFKKWGYSIKINKDTVAKYLIDKYDYDGDGRLNMKEASLMAILNSKHLMENGSCKHCFAEIINIVLDPIFEFMDCNGNEILSTEEICNGLKYLNKKDKTKYNMFNCKVDNVFYRSTSCNDLILKNKNKIQGYLSKLEFRSAILLGYWDRMTNKTNYFCNDQINDKNVRWSEDGKRDLFCEKINMFK